MTDRATPAQRRARVRRQAHLGPPGRPCGVAVGGPGARGRTTITAKSHE
ncbi:hypothetical protein [Nocardia caishijiensis]|nr:hypothetical protein [Nocardia caishijiensis]